jgi:hypothetical protein
MSPRVQLLCCFKNLINMFYRSVKYVEEFCSDQKKYIASLLLMSVKKFRDSVRNSFVNPKQIRTSRFIEGGSQKCRTPSHSGGPGFKFGPRDGMSFFFSVRLGRYRHSIWNQATATSSHTISHNSLIVVGLGATVSSRHRREVNHEQVKCEGKK